MECGGQVDEEVEHFVAKEHLARSIEVAVANSSKSGRVIHGVEDRIGYRFWALSGSESSSDKDDDVESMVSIDTPEFMRRGAQVSFSLAYLEKAGEDIVVSPSSKKPTAPKGSRAAEIITAMVRQL